MAIDRHNAEKLATELYAALARGDRERIGSLLHPEFQGRTTEGLPFDLGGTYGGPERMWHEFWRQVGKNFVARAEPTEFAMLEDGRLLASGRYTGTARRGGALDAEFVHVLSFSDGRISGLRQLTDSARWRQALDGAGRELSAIEYAVEDNVASIRLNRPDARNAINQAVGDDLYEVAQQCATDTGLRAVLITGNGPAFTVGGDIAVFADTDPAALSATLRRMTTPYHEAIRVLTELSVPVVAAVHGSVAGGGLGLLHCADVALAAEGTKFAAGFTTLGLSGDGGNSWFLPRLVGLRRAQDFYFGRRVLDATEALEWGLVTEVVPEGRLHDRARELVRSLASGPTRAYGEIRKLLRDSFTTTLPEQLAKETEALGRAAAGADSAAAVRAFMDKSEPTFEGR